ncbi:putative zn2+-binding protein melusin contains chord domain protein [Cladophialophora carrionii]|uniref:Putative zn2+-binding protein melusin contains chord domain protein n=1 Tax=Cladophialophora carrionii TaxID=86049 RepID=A0A1C1CL81_9EURO|nr:putative zn2+-binding protein melusin contains chord domain protein [Cladophialophora carrionii]
MDLEAQRLRNLQQKQKLLAELNLNNGATGSDKQADSMEVKPRAKRRRLDNSTIVQHVSSRTSARIAANGARPSYKEEKNSSNAYAQPRTKKQNDREPRRPSPVRSQYSNPKAISPSLPTDSASLIQYYTSWTPSAAPPTLDPRTNTYHFVSHPSFTPNKSPLSILLEGAFGGAYFSPWRSRTLSVTLEDDYLATLPPDWLAQLQPPEKYITSRTYNAELNRYGVQCGQMLSQWEDAGWINFQHDARGWFEWYIRFWLGRRLDDGEDERQVGRWLRCVGPKGRWKRVLLKKYVEMGIRSVFDDEDDDDAEDERRVSPVIHQTCLHWGYQVTQEDLNKAWQEREGA